MTYGLMRDGVVVYRTANEGARCQCERLLTSKSFCDCTLVVLAFGEWVEA